jgi:1-acyl-sn-glycerol-3-phosphate acyltransferase
MATASATPHPAGSSALVDAILTFLGGGDPLAVDRDIRPSLEREVDAAGAEALDALKSRMRADCGWEYYPRDPLAQRVHHLLADRYLTADSRLEGAEHLETVAGAPVTIVANHLSYADANAIEVLLQRAGAGELANRLTAIAGPKVFTSRERRFSSLCFGTLKVPQSTEVSSEEAVLTAREVAAAARRAIDIAHARLRAGDALMLFGEGTRSRTGGMQRLLPATARYLDVPGTWVLPVGLAGTEALFPVNDARLRPARVTVRVGRPVRAEELFAAARGDRRLVMDALGLALAALLPAAYGGVYADATAFSAAARACARASAPITRGASEDAPDRGM